MTADASLVIVSTGQGEQFHAYHHGFPELRADGESPAAAAANLVNDLEREIEGAPDDLHREPLRQAVADVRAFVEKDA